MNVSQQLEDLKQRLQEAEDTLTAIRTGEVDAFVVSGPYGDNIYTLQGSDHGFQTMIECMTEGAVTVNPRGQILYCNQGFASMLGLPLESLMGSPIQNVVRAEDVPMMNQLIAQSAAESATKQIILHAHEGRPVPTHISATPLTNGSGPNICLIITDLSERTRQEEKLRIKEEELHQARKIEAIGRLAGGVAHDFSNLLTGIRGLTEDMMERLSGNDDTLEDLGEILKATLRASDLTRQLLAFGRREIISPHPIDLNALIADMEKMLRRLVREDIELQIVLGDGVGRIQADPTQIQQALMNLVTNARDAMPHGGRISIETRVAEIHKVARGELLPGSYAVIEVSDAGMGMDREMLTRIFEPFFTTKPVGAGTGLGLATVFGMVKQNAGDIRVESTPGKGSIFRIFLPRLRVEAPASLSPAGSAKKFGGGETVLVVEDEKIVRTVVTRALKNVGYHVLEAKQGLEAEALCASHVGALHLLVTDVIMPGMNGRELSDRLRKRYPELLTLFMSGYPHDVIGAGGILEPGVAFIEKSFTSQSLLQRVRQTLDNEKQKI